MEDNTIPQDQIIRLKSTRLTMDNYIEMYPEDSVKILHFLDTVKKQAIKGNETSSVNNIEYLGKLLESPPSIVETPEQGCLLCKKSWNDTEGVAVMQYLCGHKYHTLCYFASVHSSELVGCCVEGCVTDDIWQIARSHYESNNTEQKKMERNIQNLVFKRKDFKEDLKILKQRITKVRQSGIAIRKLYRTKRNEIIQKHVYSINHLQADLTEGIKVLTKSQEIRSGKTSLNSFRRKAAEMYNKYHISTRDLYDRKKIKSDWELRYLLQQHRRAYSYASKYRFGIRIFPGGKEIRPESV